jgi:EAL domain-containing protein (putative c-di-GMP-specific phosphodiesterase class I)/CheY-like chemotaxis protein
MEVKKLILIIDDEADFLQTMRFFLEGANFRIITASTPEEGLEKVKLRPDLIMLDLRMPRIDGHQVCKRIKEDSTSADIPIIMFTSQDSTLDKVEAFELGVADYIGKNFSFEEIIARIQAVLRQASAKTNSQANEERSKRIIELRSIIENKNLRMLYQPIVNLTTRKPIGFEALTRGPAGTFLESPINLFTLATEANMFIELNTICLTLAAKKADFIAPGELLFLNIDPLMIDAEHIKNMDFLKGSSIKPSQVSLEITERVYVKNFAKLSSDLNYFKSLGVKISIDDIGEGYSSLKALAELKPEFMKVTLDLVRNVDKDEGKRGIIQVIVDLAKRLNGIIIAEGIETEEENNTLISMGVEFGQGYLFAKPQEPEKLKR